MEVQSHCALAKLMQNLLVLVKNTAEKLRSSFFFFFLKRENYRIDHIFLSFLMLKDINFVDNMLIFFSYIQFVESIDMFSTYFDFVEF